MIARGNGYTYSGTQTPVAERPVGELFGELAQDTRSLVQLELELAKTELSQKAAAAGKDAGFIAAGGFVAYAGFLAIVAALGYLLGNFIPTWLAFLIVGVLVALGGYMLMRKGLDGLKHITPAPEQTIATLKEGGEWLKGQRH